MKHSPLQSVHEQAQAGFLPYGQEIQIVETYGYPELEYGAIRKSVAIREAPHRAAIILTGKDRLSFLNNLLTNDTKTLQPGAGIYAYALNGKGRIIMDMNILQAEDTALLELDARLVPDFATLFEKYHFSEEITLLNADTAGEDLGRISLIGPQSETLLKTVWEADSASERVLSEGGVSEGRLSEPLRHAKGLLAGARVRVFRQDQCGVPQYELIVPAESMQAVWETLKTHDPENREEGTRTIGWAAYNIARIEAGTPLYGIDITDNYLPMETGHWYAKAVSITKGCYLGQEVVARMHAHKTVARVLVGLQIDGDTPPTAGSPILHQNTQIGIITSSCHSPMKGNTPIAMGYVKTPHSSPGTPLEILTPTGPNKATVSPVPFI